MIRRFIHHILLAAIVLAVFCTSQAAETNAVPLSAVVLDGGVLHLRVSTVSAAFEGQFRAAAPASGISGTVLDLRFAGGDSAASATNCFPAAHKKPLAILVNARTSGAALELAAALRREGRGILIGSTNAPAAVRLDIAVEVTEEVEMLFRENPTAQVAGRKVELFSATNSLLPIVDHTNEAELVRRHVKDSEFIPDPELAPTRPEPASPVIRDPALARAVDFIKAATLLNLKSDGRISPAEKRPKSE